MHDISSLTVQFQARDHETGCSRTGKRSVAYRLHGSAAKLGDMGELAITVHDDHVSVEVHVVPRASRAAVQGVHDGKLKIALDAPPVDGEANQALVALLAKLLKLKKSDVRLVRGQTSRTKLVALYGASAQAVRALVPDGSA